MWVTLFNFFIVQYLWFKYVCLYFWGAYNSDNKHVSITIFWHFLSLCQLFYCLIYLYVSISICICTDAWEWLRAVGDTELLEIPLGAQSFWKYHWGHFRVTVCALNTVHQTIYMPVGDKNLVQFQLVVTPNQLKCWVSNLADEHEDKQHPANPPTRSFG